jgi:hypothetical protein
MNCEALNYNLCKWEGQFKKSSLWGPLSDHLHEVGRKLGSGDDVGKKKEDHEGHMNLASDA